MLIIIAFERSAIWGLAVFLAFVIPFIGWVLFIACAKSADLTAIGVPLVICFKRHKRVDLCTFLLSLLLLTVSPFFYFLVCSLSLMEMWDIQEHYPEQYFFVNANLLVKLLILVPQAATFLAFTVV